MSPLECAMHISCTVKEEIFMGEKFRTFPYKTFRTKFNFVLSGSGGPARAWAFTRALPLKMEEYLVWNLISYFFQSHESYEIKFLTKISCLTVHGCFQTISCNPTRTLKLHYNFLFEKNESLVYREAGTSGAFACRAPPPEHPMALQWLRKLKKKSVWKLRGDEVRRWVRMVDKHLQLGTLVFAWDDEEKQFGETYPILHWFPCLLQKSWHPTKSWQGMTFKAVFDLQMKLPPFLQTYKHALWHENFHPGSMSNNSVHTD